MTWEAILHRVRSSNEIFRLTVDECVELYNNAPLHQLMAAAHHRRLLHNPSNEVTYLVDRNINYTNVCTIIVNFAPSIVLLGMMKPIHNPMKKYVSVLWSWKR